MQSFLTGGSETKSSLRVSLMPRHCLEPSGITGQENTSHKHAPEFVSSACLQFSSLVSVKFTQFVRVVRCTQNDDLV